MDSSKRTLRMAVPKGSLEKATAEFLTKAGLELDGYGRDNRNYRPKIGVQGVEVKVLRPQEIPVLISRECYDLGITGLDWYRESRCERSVEDMGDLGFGKVDVVLAVPSIWNDVKNAETSIGIFIFLSLLP